MNKIIEKIKESLKDQKTKNKLSRVLLMYFIFVPLVYLWVENYVPYTNQQLTFIMNTISDNDMKDVTDQQRLDLLFYVVLAALLVLLVPIYLMYRFAEFITRYISKRKGWEIAAKRS